MSPMLESSPPRRGTKLGRSSRRPSLRPCIGFPNHCHFEAEHLRQGGFPLGGKWHFGAFNFAQSRRPYACLQAELGLGESGQIPKVGERTFFWGNRDQILERYAQHLCYARESVHLRRPGSPLPAIDGRCADIGKASEIADLEACPRSRARKRFPIEAAQNAPTQLFPRTFMVAHAHKVLVRSHRRG